MPKQVVMHRIYKIKITSIQLVLYSYILLTVLIVIPFHAFIRYNDIQIGGSTFENDSILKKLILVVFFGPALETLIFQIGIINLIKRVLAKKPAISVIISALLFGLSHFYSDIYMYYTFVIGLFLGTLYFVASKKEFNPFLVIFSVHALVNLMLFIAFEFVL